MLKKQFITVLFFILVAGPVFSQLVWPEITSETKPWTRWWWPGSIVTQKDISRVMEQYSSAGLGGLELTVIYGVKGQEEKFINFLSPEWMKMFSHTLNEASRLGMGIDMANASSWPFGGPWVTDDDASKYVAFKSYALKGGESLKDRIEYIQEPFIRWNSTYRVDIKEIKDPVYINRNLQQLAIDQIRFEKPIPLQSLMAYSDDGKIIDLTGKVDNKGNLLWTAPVGNWTLYAVFMGWHGKMVERAGPGGEGYVIDHFSKQAVKNYLSRFDRAFEGYDISYLRGFFNDSYEVDDARGQSDWTPSFFDEFIKRRGYDLREHLPALFQKDNPDKNVRILMDYRLTISDLILDNFTRGWSEWAHKQGKITRNQAHGSPGNILDLYAASDIPETEGTEILRMKFGTSAANVTGKKLASAEAATWLDEHFSSNLSDIKKAVDKFFISGVNHILYHGTCYSPPDEPWPGFQFYAAVELNPANPVWNDFHALNDYVTRVQSFMQTGKPDNELLLYFPVFDRYADYNNAMLEHFDGINKGFSGSHFMNAAEYLTKKGYTFDFVSDNQIKNCRIYKGDLVTEGNTGYKAILVPQCKYMPVETFNKLINLADDGAIIILYGELPQDVSGFKDFELNHEIFEHLKDQLKFQSSGNQGIKTAISGSGKVVMGDDIDALLEVAGVQNESFSDYGLQFCRRKDTDGTIYFVYNESDKPFASYVKLESSARSAGLFNPMTGEKGTTKIRKSADGKPELYLKLLPYETIIIKVFRKNVSDESYPFYEPVGNSVNIEGEWNLQFESGGPVIPLSVKLSEPGLWSEFGGDDYNNFSGSAVYSTTFAQPAVKGKYFMLDFGKVYESAEVKLNGEYFTTLIGPYFQIVVPAGKIKKSNLIEIKVSNLAANRIAYMDRKGIEWKKFYNVNFASRLPQNRKNGLFDASAWPVRPSGMKGPITITAVKMIKR